jgi:DNA-binding GntR family transcriptional regulator
MASEKRTKTSDLIYEEIKRRIIEFEYEPNEHLSEEHLAESLQVSRTPLREALFRLQLEHLVTKQSTGRIVVSRLTISEAEELYQVREFLQALVAREAALNMTAPLLAKLDDKMAQMRQSAADGQYAEMVANGRDFHKLLYEAVPNGTVIRFLEQLRNRIDRYRRIGGYKYPNYSPQLPIEEHQHILECIRRGDADGAEAAMRLHIRNSLERTKEVLQVSFVK